MAMPISMFILKTGKLIFIFPERMYRVQQMQKIGAAIRNSAWLFTRLD